MMMALVLLNTSLRSMFLTLLLLLQQDVAAWLGYPVSDMAVLIGLAILGTLMATLFSRPLFDIAGINHSVTIATGLTTGVVGLMIAGDYFLPNQSILRLLFMAPLVLVAGCTTGILVTAMKAIVGDATTEKQKQRLNGVWTAASPLGLCFGAAASTLATNDSIWSASFMIFLALSGALFVSQIFIHIEQPKKIDSAPHYDYRGLFFTCLAILIFEIWSAWTALEGFFKLAPFLLFTATLALSVIAVRAMTREANPIIPVHLLRSHTFAVAVLICVIIEMSTTQEFEILFLGEDHALPRMAIGERTVLGNIAAVLGTIVAGSLLHLLTAKRVLVMGLAILSLGLVSYCLYPFNASEFLIFVTRCLSGFGYGIAIPALLSLAYQSMQNESMGGASILLVGSLLIGSEIGLVLLHTIFSAAELFTHSETTPYLIVFVLQVVIVLALFPIIVLGYRADDRTAVEAG